MHSRAQISIEYLIVLASFFAMLCIVVPMAAHLYQLTTFAIDVQNAKSFVSQMAFTSSSFENYSAGSKKSFDFQSENSCAFNANGNKISLTISNPVLGKQENLQANSKLNFKGQYNFECTHLSLELIKDASGLVVNKN